MTKVLVADETPWSLAQTAQETGALLIDSPWIQSVDASTWMDRLTSKLLKPLADPQNLQLQRNIYGGIHMFFARPATRQLDVEHAKELDDEFFQSRPIGYFASRIESLLRDRPKGSAPSFGTHGEEFASRCGVESPSDVLGVSEEDWELQVAVDAFSVRHHAAESLVRLYHALTIGAESEAAARSTWCAVVEGPSKTVDLVKQARLFMDSREGVEDFWRLVFPEKISQHPEMAEEANQSLNVMADWVRHAMSLLVRDDININAANNKIKHGLAVRPKAKTLATITTIPPNADGSVPLSALSDENSFNVLEGITAEYLSRPQTPGRRQGLEMTVLNLRPVTLLTEAWLIATVHAAMFHIAAAKHFADRDVTIQPYPALPLDTTPERVVGGAAIGVRYPVTTPPDGGLVDRVEGIAFPNHFLSTKFFSEEPQKGVIVDG